MQVRLLLRVDEVAAVIIIIALILCAIFLLHLWVSLFIISALQGISYQMAGLNDRIDQMRRGEDPE